MAARLFFGDKVCKPFIICEMVEIVIDSRVLRYIRTSLSFLSQVMVL